MDCWVSPQVEQQFEKTVTGIFQDRVFTVIKVNVLRDPINRREAYPVELSLAAFSLTAGVISTMVAMIRPDPPLTGLGYAVKELHDHTGLPRIGLDDDMHFNDDHRDYETIALQVKEFITQYAPRGAAAKFSPKIVFAMSSDIQDAKDGLRWLGRKCCDDTLEHVKRFFSELEFLNLAHLFLKLCKFTHQQNKDYMSAMVQFEMDAVAERKLNKPDSNSFQCEISCRYHSEYGFDKMDMCAKNWILKRIFVILDELKGPLNLVETRGHSPLTYAKPLAVGKEL